MLSLRRGVSQEMRVVGDLGTRIEVDGQLSSVFRALHHRSEFPPEATAHSIQLLSLVLGRNKGGPKAGGGLPFNSHSLFLELLLYGSEKLAADLTVPVVHLNTPQFPPYRGFVSLSPVVALGGWRLEPPQRRAHRVGSGSATGAEGWKAPSASPP